MFPMLSTMSLNSTLECQEHLTEQTYAKYQGAQGTALLFLFILFQEDRLKEEKKKKYLLIIASEWETEERNEYM